MKLSFTLDVAEGATPEHCSAVADEVSDALIKICAEHPGFTPRYVTTDTDEYFEAKRAVGA